MVEIALFERGVGHFERQSQEKGASPTNDFWHQKTRVPVLSYGEKNCRKVQPPEQGAPTLETDDRQQTDRQTTDGIATASSEREREFTSAKNVACVVCDMFTHESKNTRGL